MTYRSFCGYLLVSAVLSLSGVCLTAQSVDLWQPMAGLEGRTVSRFGGGTFHSSPDGSLFVQSGAIFRSDDGGRNWQQASGHGLPSEFGFRIAVGPGGDLLAAGSEFISQGTPLRLFRSTNSGANWKEVQIGSAPPIDILFDFVTLTSGDLLIVTFNFEDPEETHRIWRSSDGGFSWSNTHSEPLGGTWRIVEAPDGTVLASPSDPAASVVMSKDNGQTWDEAGVLGAARGFGFSKGDYFLGMLFGGQDGGSVEGALFRSTDGGATWVETGNGLPSDSWICAMTGTPDGQLFAATGGLESLGGAAKNAVYRSDDQGDTWVATSPVFPDFSGRDHDGAVCGGDLFYTTTGDLLLAPGERRLQRSPNSGSTWMPSSKGLPIESAIYPRFGPDGNLFVAGQGGPGLYRTSDLGATWDLTEMASADTNGMSFGPEGTVLIRAGNNSVWLSKDSGQTWMPTNPLPEGPESNPFVGVVPSSTLVTPASTLLIGTNEGIFRSTDEGSNWARVVASDSFITFMVATPQGTLLAAERGERMRRSTDDGVSWTSAGFAVNVSDMVVRDDGAILAATYGDGICLSTDDGLTWTPKNSGLPSSDVNSVATTSEGVVFTISESHLPPEFILTTELYFSTDTAESWQKFEPAFPSGPATPMGIAFGPNDEFIVGSWNGLYRGLPDVMANLTMPQYASGGSASASEEQSEPNRTRVILINNGEMTDRGVIRFRDTAGELQPVSIGGVESSEAFYVVGPRGTLDIETDGSGPLQTGVIEVVSDLGNASVLEGTEAFYLLGKSVSISGVDPVTSLQIYVSRSSNENTGVALYNPDLKNTITVNAILYDSQGVEQIRKEVELSPRAQLARFVDEAELFKDYFTANPSDFTGTMSLNGQSEATFSGTALLQDRDSAALIAVSTESAGDPGQLLFAQFVNGEIGEQLNNTRVILINAGGSADTGVIAFQDSLGAGTSVPILGIPTQTVNYSLEPRNTTELTTDGTGALQTGVIEVNSDQPEISGIVGTEVFETLGNFVSVSSSPPREANQAYVSVTGRENTGVAIYNPDREQMVTITAIMVDAAGKERARRELELAPAERLVGFVNQEFLFKDYFDANPGTFTGTLNILAGDGKRVAVLALLQDRSSGALIAVRTSEKAFDPSD